MRITKVGFRVNIDFCFGVEIKIFSNPLLNPYRQAVVDKKLGAELKKRVNKVSGKGYLIDGKHYKKILNGFDAEHPNTEFLL